MVFRRLYMKMEAAGAGRDPSQPVQVAKMAYCDAHTPAHVLQVIIKLYKTFYIFIYDDMCM